MRQQDRNIILFGNGFMENSRAVVYRGRWKIYSVLPRPLMPASFTQNSLYLEGKYFLDMVKHLLPLRILLSDWNIQAYLYTVERGKPRRSSGRI